MQPPEPPLAARAGTAGHALPALEHDAALAAMAHRPGPTLRRSLRKDPLPVRRVVLLAPFTVALAAGTIRPLSLTSYTSVVKHRIVPRIGHLRPQGLSGGHLNAFYAELEKAGLSVASRRLTHAVISRALRDAVRWEKTTRNAADAADPPATAETRATAWTAGELSRFLAHVETDRWFPIWRLAAVTGMRRGELLGLTWFAVDLENGSLRVDRQLVPTRGGVSFGPPKSKRSRRTVALDRETVEILKRHREAQLLERQLAGDAYTDRTSSLRPRPGCRSTRRG